MITSERPPADPAEHARLLAELTAEHRQIDDRIKQLERHLAMTSDERAELAELKKHKLRTKERIALLSR
ncbi:MAG: YdcH family protein [Kofleriaceae bacterium]|jgi:uncharacterized protein YdcH (DUF465 family)|nr:YdcH family protein [Kofleriaceae bacterium]MBP6840478.1 YdcH family protein [Kofleriaceae bacterium]MBP9202756.1 YdcH family protein [Kofleriaceae bacterium]